MAFRSGTCTSCKASFRVPESVTASTAKCSKCGGRVAVGAVLAEGASADKPILSPAPSSSSGATAKPSPRSPQSASGAPPSATSRAATRQGNDTKGRTDRVNRMENQGKKKLDPKLVAVALVAFVLVDVGIYFAWQKNVEAKKSEDAKVEPGAAPAGTAASAKPADPTKPGVPTKTAEPAKPAEPPDASGIPDYTPGRGTTPARWAELKTLATAFFEAPDGHAADKAADGMLEETEDVFPLLLNQFKKLNLEDDRDFHKADRARKLLADMCPGATIGWKAKGEADWLEFDRKAIKSWCELWDRGRKEKGYWKQIIKVGSATPPAPEPPAGATPPVKKDG